MGIFQHVLISTINRDTLFLFLSFSLHPWPSLLPPGSWHGYCGQFFKGFVDAHAVLVIVFITSFFEHGKLILESLQRVKPRIKTNTVHRVQRKVWATRPIHSSNFQFPKDLVFCFLPDTDLILVFTSFVFHNDHFSQARSLIRFNSNVTLPWVLVHGMHLSFSGISLFQGEVELQRVFPENIDYSLVWSTVAFV